MFKIYGNDAKSELKGLSPLEIHVPEIREMPVKGLLKNNLEFLYLINTIIYNSIVVKTHFL